MSVTVNVINPASVERRRPPNDTVHFISLLKQQLCQVRTILASNASKKRPLPFSDLFSCHYYISLLVAERSTASLRSGCNNRPAKLNCGIIKFVTTLFSSLQNAHYNAQQLPVRGQPSRGGDGRCTESFAGATAAGLLTREFLSTRIAD
jgi:hypothetical protein